MKILIPYLAYKMSMPVPDDDDRFWNDEKVEILNILLKKKEPKFSALFILCVLYHHDHDHDHNLVAASANLPTFRFYSIISFSIFF